MLLSIAKQELCLMCWAVKTRFIDSNTSVSKFGVLQLCFPLFLNWREKKLHQKMQRAHAQEAPGPTWIARQLTLISSAPFPAMRAQPGLSSFSCLWWIQSGEAQIHLYH